MCFFLAVCISVDKCLFIFFSFSIGLHVFPLLTPMVFALLFSFQYWGVTSHTFCMLGTHSISKLLGSSSPSSSHLVVLWVQVGHCEDGTGYRLGQQGQWLWASRLKVMWHLLLGSTAVTCVLFG